MCTVFTAVPVKCCTVTGRCADRTCVGCSEACQQNEARKGWLVEELRTSASRCWSSVMSALTASSRPQTQSSPCSPSRSVPSLPLTACTVTCTPTIGRDLYLLAFGLCNCDLVTGCICLLHLQV
jgi:hypothetical protein